VQKGSDLVRATQDYVAYFDGVADERRRHPTDDVASLVAHSQIDGRPIGHYEASSYYIQLASAGHDTVSSTIAGGLLELIRNPDEWRKLQADPGLVPLAVEEMVRWVSPVKHFFRTAREDSVLRGQAIQAGQNLLLSLPVGQPRRGGLRRPVCLPCRPQPEQARGLRLRRACLPGHVPGEDGIADPLPRDPAACRRLRARR
jgi:hypothetical protein